MKKGRRTALARAEHGDNPVSLDASQKTVLAEAIREGGQRVCARPRADMKPAEREEIAGEIEKLRDLLADIARTLKRG